jgi:hypothetical protein
LGQTTCHFRDDDVDVEVLHVETAAHVGEVFVQLLGVEGFLGAVSFGDHLFVDLVEARAFVGVHFGKGSNFVNAFH